jgi:hypothetical protein
MVAGTDPGAGDARRRGSMDRGAHGAPGTLRRDRKQENDHHGGRRLAREQEERGVTAANAKAEYGDRSDRTTAKMAAIARKVATTRPAG